MVAVEDKVILGKGTQGIVWESDCGHVCKQFNDEEEYEREKEFSYYVEHLSFVPRYYNFDDTASIITMEKIEWGELKELEKLVATKELGETIVDNIIDCILQMWNAGIEHNDLHFGNILVNPDDGDIKIIDFGYAQEVTGTDLSAPYFIEEIEGYVAWNKCDNKDVEKRLLNLVSYAKSKWTQLIDTIKQLEERSMYFEILDEPKYVNQVLIALEGYYDDSYITTEMMFSIEQFKESVGKDLCDILKKAHNGYFNTLGELQNDSFNLIHTSISNCTELTGHEVSFFDKKGVCKHITMNWRENHE